MIRWGTLIAGGLGFCLVMSLGIGLGQSWDKTLVSAAMGSLAFGLCGHWWMALWLRNFMAAKVEQAELKAIAIQNASAAKAERETEQFKETD